MTTLKDRLRRELTTSMKARNELRSSTLRMVLAAITNAEVAGKQARQLSDDEVVGVLASESRKRKEASAAFAQAGRSELAAKEDAEAVIIAEFLPSQLSDEEIQQVVGETITSLGVSGEGVRAMGSVMAALQSQVRGRADGGAVAAEVRRQLSA